MIAADVFVIDKLLQLNTFQVIPPSVKKLKRQKKTLHEPNKETKSNKKIASINVHRSNIALQVIIEHTLEAFVMNSLILRYSSLTIGKDIL